MRFDLDQALAIHARALHVGNQRMEVLAANIANADTPGYLARDLDFRSVMRATGADQADPSRLARTHAAHLTVTGGQADVAEVLYRTAVQPSLDGNTVDTDRESAAVAETAVRYEATLMFLNSKIRGLRLAITGSA